MKAFTRYEILLRALDTIVFKDGSGCHLDYAVVKGFLRRIICGNMSERHFTRRAFRSMTFLYVVGIIAPYG